DPGKSQVKGFIPTGWYPTSVAVTPDGKRILVGVGKGNQIKPNPLFKDEPKEEKETKTRAAAAGTPQFPCPYIGTTVSGALSVVLVPDEKQLVAYTAQIYKNWPYSDKAVLPLPVPLAGDGAVGAPRAPVRPPSPVRPAPHPALTTTGPGTT